MRILLKVVYWLAVLAISVALVIGLILWFESRDESEIEGSGAVARPSVLPDSRRLAPNEAREHDDSLRGAVERMTRAQHEPVVWHRA
jgi:hypothetical protein